MSPFRHLQITLTAIALVAGIALGLGRESFFPPILALAFAWAVLTS